MVNTNAIVCNEIAPMNISYLDDLINVIQLIGLQTQPDTSLKDFVSPSYLLGNILKINSIKSIAIPPL